MRMKYLLQASAVCAALASPAAAHGPDEGKGEIVTPNFAQQIPNIPGKSLIAVIVDYPPGAKSPPHRHAASAFIYGFVVSGSVRTHVDGEGVKIVKAGESFYEAPGSHHLEGGNASESEPAKLLAVFVVDTDDKELTTPDKQ